MNRPLLLAAGFASSLLMNACGDAGSAIPTAPTGPTSTRAAAPAPTPQGQEPRPPATGTISMTASSPGAGASLLVGECRSGSVTRLCAEGWHGTFDVSLDRGMVSAVLIVSFLDGDVLCGYAADVQERILPGETVTYRLSRISLSDEFGNFSRPCALPATTTHMVATLLSDADWETQLTQTFSGSYTFTRP